MVHSFPSRRLSCFSLRRFPLIYVGLTVATLVACVCGLGSTRSYFFVGLSCTVGGDITFPNLLFRGVASVQLPDLGVVRGTSSVASVTFLFAPKDLTSVVCTGPLSGQSGTNSKSCWKVWLRSVDS